MAHIAVKSEAEEQSMRLLVAHLASLSEGIEVVGSPDLADRSRSAPDYEVSVLVDGRIVAVEVTNLAQARRDWLVASRVETAIHATLDPVLEAEELGGFYATLRALEAPPDREVPSVAQAIAGSMAEVAHGLRQSHGTEWVPVPVPEGAGRYYECEMQAREGASHVAFLTRGSTLGTNITAQASDYVRWLMRKKATQAAGYGEAWILIRGTETLIEANTLKRAFEEHRADMPANWRRVFYISPIDGSLGEVRLPTRADAT